MMSTTSSVTHNSGKQILLTVAVVLTITLVYSSGMYPPWLEKRIIYYFNDFKSQIGTSRTTEERKEEFYGTIYEVCQTVRKHMDKTKQGNPVVLIEPNEYLMKTLGIKMPEPIVFYYHTNGIQCVLTNSVHVDKANFFLQLTKEGINILPIHSESELQAILKKYSHYTNTL